MKLFLLLLLGLAAVSCALAGGNPLEKLCDPSDPGFLAQHSAAWSQIAANNDQGWVWHQSTSVVMPVPTDNGVMFVEIQHYTWYHHVVWSDEKCAYIEIQLWPKYAFNPVTYEAVFAGWGIQEIEVGHKNPAYRQTDSIPPLPELAFTEYTVQWNTPYLADSANVMGAITYEAGLGPDTMMHSWHSPLDNSVVFSGFIVNYEQGHYREYTYGFRVQTVPGVPESVVKIMVSIESRAAQAPQEILDALAWYDSVKDLEDPPLTQDPGDLTGQLPPVFIYSPPAEKVAEDSANVSDAIPASTHGLAFPINSLESYNLALAALAGSQE